MMKGYVKNVLTGVSILANVLLGGSPQHTLAVEQYMRKRTYKFNIVFLIDGVFIFLGTIHNLFLRYVLKSVNIKSWSHYCLEQWTKFMYDEKN